VGVGGGGGEVSVSFEPDTTPVPGVSPGAASSVVDELGEGWLLVAEPNDGSESPVALSADASAIAMVDRLLDTDGSPVCVGSSAHSTAAANATPTVPVATDNPRPMTSGGSLCAQAAMPTSLG